ncbi:hypothetical protein RND81_10G227900 [Saponaria officinalis]|uniref:Uncharacterized protein n=1 Tax=Saponaria officinalis TaxID=3572 RepID=A0AAW1I6C4_SAPOF
MQQDIMNSGASSSLSTISPSFNSYSSENIADIAARVIHELNISHEHHYDDDFYPSIPQNDAVLAADDENNDNESDNGDDDDEEGEFEFAVLCGEDMSSPISADEIFSNGQIKPIYPVFGHNYDAVLDGSKTASLRLPLRKLMREDRERSNDSVSSSSSDDNAELEGVPRETYCVWAPPKKNEGNEVTMKKKSNSTGTGVGTSKRWRFKDLLHRSNSDGKDTFVFLNNNGNKREKVTAVNSKISYGGGKKTEDIKTKKKSYAPDVIGFFGNVNGINRTIRPF